MNVTDSDPSHYYGFQSGQQSIEVNSLTADWTDEDGGTLRRHLTGVFNITDASGGRSDPDGFLIGLETYDVDWTYKVGGPKNPDEVDFGNGPGGGYLFINGEKVFYTVMYSLVDIAGDTSVAGDLGIDGDNDGYNDGDSNSDGLWQEGEDWLFNSIIFDESVNIEYTVWFDTSLPDRGSLLGSVNSVIVFGRDKEFFASSPKSVSRFLPNRRFRSIYAVFPEVLRCFQSGYRIANKLRIRGLHIYSYTT